MASHRTRSDRPGPACSACRARRVGCDRIRPTCGRCREASRVCTYNSPRQPATTEFTFVDETPHIAASSALPQAESMPYSGLNRSSDNRPPMVEIPASRLEEIETRLEMLTASVRAMQSSEYPLRSSPGTPSQQATTTAPLSMNVGTAETGMETTSGTLNLDRLSLQGNGRARFVTGVFWANICDEATAIDELLREQTRYTGIAAANSAQSPIEPKNSGTEPSGLTRTNSANSYQMFPLGDMIAELDCWHEGPPRSSRFQRLMPDIVPELPPKSLCDHLFECFRSYYHVIAPVVHIPTTKSKYNTFWELDTLARRTRAAAYTPLIIAILFAGAAACDEPTIAGLSGQTKGEIMVSLHKLTAKTLRCVNFPRTPTLESFAAFIIIQNTCMREEQPLTNCSYAGTAVRVAQMLGCNHDPSRHGVTDPIEAEVRRRISWSVFYLDTMIALAAGLPPFIDTDHWSVQPMSELKDEFIGTAEGVAYDEDIRAGKRESGHAGAEESLVSSYGIFATGKYHATVVTRYVLEKLYGEKPITARAVIEVQTHLEQLASSLSSRITRLPQSVTDNSSNAEAVFVKWTRLLLSALADRNWIYLYHPLSRVHRGPNTEVILNHILDCSRTYLERIVALTSLEEFGPLQWSWPGIHQPLHAVMVLLRHVNKHPNSPTSEASRQVIDEVIALCGPDGGMTGIHNGQLDRPPLREGGQQVWDLIRRLRAQAWIKAGFDPDILLTRDEIETRVRSRLSAEQRLEHEATSAPAFDVLGDMDLELGDEFRSDVDPMAFVDETVDWFQWD